MAIDWDAELQTPEVDARAVIGLVAGFLVFVAISAIGLGLYYAHAYGAAEAAPRQAFPQPRLETRNRQDLEALLKSQRDVLQSYAWVDRGRGLVRIPIARAMEILAGRGAGVYDPPDPSEPPPIGGAP